MTQLERKIRDFASGSGKRTIQVLDDLLSYICGYFDPIDGKIDGWSYGSEDNERFYDMMREYFLLMEEELRHREWHDAWGDLYMALIAKGDGKGQFFTSVGVCEAMAQMTISDEGWLAGKGQNTTFGNRIVISDPSAGSGRNLLAGGARIVKLTNRSPYLIAEDLDETCCKMCAVNIALHGWFGEVVCHDTLCEPDKVRRGWIINETMYPFRTNVPSVRRCDDPRRFISVSLFAQKKQEVIRKTGGTQLSLF